MAQATRNVSLGLGDGRFPEGLHLCHIFNDDDERAKTLARFIERGLREGERALCLVDAMTADEVHRHLGEAGVDVAAVGARFAVACAEPTYCLGGSFVPDVCLAAFGQFVEQSKAEGCTGARIMGDMSWAVRRGTTTEALLEYEAKVKEYVERFPVTAVCEYDARMFDGATVLDILAMHPAMIVRGQVVINPYFEEPYAYLARYRARHAHAV